MIAGALAAAALGCDRRPATVLECSTTGNEIRHVLRLRGDNRVVDDLSFNPPHVGTAEVTDSGYVLRFSEVPGCQLLFRVNRFTGDGTRELSCNGKLIVPGGYDTISCKPYAGKPL